MLKTPYTALENIQNESYSPTWRPLGLDTHIGIGHGYDLSNPDYTYNHKDWRGRDWNNNYKRTTEMAETVYAQMVSFAKATGSKGTAANWSDIKSVVEQFAAVEASEQGGLNGATMEKKIKVLADWLNDPTFAWAQDKNSAGNGYTESAAVTNRADFLKNLKPDEFAGVMFK